MKNSNIKKPNIKLNFLDKALAYISPNSASRRLGERVKYESSLSYLNKQGLLGNQGYTTNTSNKRNMRGWNATANPVDVDTLPKRDSITACSRDLYMNASIGRAIINRTSTNTIGTGLRLKPQIEREFLGFTGDTGVENANKWEENTQRQWESWSNSIFSDAELTLTTNENALLSFTNMLLSGDVFIALPGVDLPGQTYRTKLKVIESDYVCNPNHLIETLKIAGGVETNQLGAPIAYHFRIPDQNSTMNFGPIGFDKWRRVPRFNEQGLQQVLHLFVKERPAQKRGISILAPFIEEIKEITRYRGAELDAAILNAFFTVFIKSTNNVDGKQLQEGYFPPTIENPLGVNDATTIRQDGQPSNDALYEMGKANILEMDDNQDITLADPKHPISGYDKFFEAIVTEIAAGTGISYEVLIQKFQSSFSASKAALQEAWKLFLQYRKFMITHFYSPVYETFITEAIGLGTIKAPGFFTDPVIKAAWLKASWIGSGQGMIDPAKETKAAVERIDARLSNREKEFQQLNSDNSGDWAGTMENFAKEEQLLEKLDIKPISKEEVALASISNEETNEETEKEE